jgi:hypothetical protein
MFEGVLAEADICPTPHGRLFAKLLVFKNTILLRRFWTSNLNKGELGRWTVGAVNGLVKSKLSMAVIVHESVHAGFCYAKRVKRTPWAAARSFDEEEVAYPAGEIARKINIFLWKKELYPSNESS